MLHRSPFSCTAWLVGTIGKHAYPSRAERMYLSCNLFHQMIYCPFQKRCADAPTTLVSVFQRLPLLRHLRLRGAPANTILPILALLPDLRSLDTEYHVANSTSFFSDEKSHSLHLTENGITGIQSPTLPALQHITVRTSFKPDKGFQMLWKWVCDLVPFPSLETFRLHGFPWNSDAEIPRSFIINMTDKHGATLKHFVVSDCYISLENLQWLSSKFLILETLECSLVSPNLVCHSSPSSFQY